MSGIAKTSPHGSDWTRLLTDPDLVSHLGKLLQTYREVAPEKREASLLQAMREIKQEALRARQPQTKTSVDAGAPSSPLPTPQPVTVAPPFEPEPLSSLEISDRRRHPRIKCYVAVELHVDGMEEAIWGNLSNVSRGGCLVETACGVPPGKAIEIGLWVSSGKLWVKGVIINGVVTRSTPSYGVRVKFSEAEISEKEHLREFLKFVENAARKSQSGHAYVAQLKS